jgi:hypothetical protein
VTFTDLAGALPLGAPSSGNYAARSLDNYRELYRTYRSDPELQRVHELYPFIVVWDDHEYSDDCWGAHATYSDGARTELDVERRRNAERAFLSTCRSIRLYHRRRWELPRGSIPARLRFIRRRRFGGTLILVRT